MKYALTLIVRESTLVFNHIIFSVICNQITVQLMPASKRPTSNPVSHQMCKLSKIAMMSTGLVSLSCHDLRQLLDLVLSTDVKPSNILILDCRPFLIHNDSHIVQSINIHCPAIIRRRTGNQLPLKTIIPDPTIRERLVTDYYYPIVLFEEQDPSPDSIGTYVAKCLQTEAHINNIHILEGGFSKFRQLFPYFCTKGNSIPMALSNSSSVNISSRSPNSSHTWPMKSTPKGFLTPRTPKNNNLNVDFAAPLSFGNDQAEPVEILPYLYLGSEYHASCKPMLKNLGITALLNVSHTCPNHFEDCFRYKSIPIEDSKSEDISVWFSEAIDFIDQVKNCNGKALIHCHAGISRSATICMAYLMATKRIRMEEAYEYVKSKRKIISPNFNFMGQLLGFETQVFSPTNPSREKEQTLKAPVSPMTASMASSSTNISNEELTSPEKLRVNSAPSTPSRIRAEAQRLVFDFTQVPVTSQTSFNASQIVESPI